MPIRYECDAEGCGAVFATWEALQNHLIEHQLLDNDGSNEEGEED